MRKDLYNYNRIFYKTDDKYKLSFKNKFFWLTIFIPSTILEITKVISYMIEKRSELLVFFNIAKEYFAMCSLMFFLIIIIYSIISVTRDFIKEDYKGKIIYIVIFLVFLYKEIFQILHTK